MLSVSGPETAARHTGTRQSRDTGSSRDVGAQAHWGCGHRNGDRGHRDVGTARQAGAAARRTLQGGRGGRSQASVVSGPSHGQRPPGAALVPLPEELAGLAGLQQPCQCRPCGTAAGPAWRWGLSQPHREGRKEGKSARESSHARTVGDGGAVTRLVGEAHTAGDALWWCQAGWFQLRVAPSSQRLLVLGINPGRGHTPLPSQRSWHPCHSARNPIWEQGGRRDTDTRTWVMRRRKVLEGAAAHPAPAPRHEGMVKGAGGNTSTDPLAGVRGTRSHWHGPAGPQLPLPSTTAGTRLCPWEHTVHSGMGVQSCPRADYQLTRWIVANRLWEWDNSCGHESSWIWSHHQSSELLPSSLHRSPGNQPPSLHSLESHSSSSKPRVGGTGCDSMG